MRKIYVVGHQRAYASWMEGELVSDLEDADLVVFTGGEDIEPAIYGKRAHKASWFNRARDAYEIKCFQQARDLDKKIVGICRGAQLTCALAGGILVQHQNHPWEHEMNTSNGKIIRTTSTHHQRQYPWGGRKPNFELLGWAMNLSPFSEGESNEDDMRDGKPEAEVVLYPDVKALAIQGHPEYAYPSLQPWEHEFIGYCREQLDRLMAL
jgi:Peptidase C26